jgi:hypothetical protein
MDDELPADVHGVEEHAGDEGVSAAGQGASPSGGDAIPELAAGLAGLLDSSAYGHLVIPFLPFL